MLPKSRVRLSKGLNEAEWDCGRCTGAIFMFPGMLAEGPFSLRQGERSCTLSISAELSPEGELLAHSVVASHVTPARRMTYHEVDEALVSNDPTQLSPDLRALHQVTSWPLGCGKVGTCKRARNMH